MEPSAFSKISYDYVIVGGGTAGLALATLLSNTQSISVGVIEAGIHRKDDKILIPGRIGSTLGDPDFDWSFSSIPQDHAHGRSIAMSRGKVLGGTSALNFMAFTRAPKVELDDWSSLGVSGWGWDTVDRGIRQSEKYTPPQPEIIAKFYGDTSPQSHGSHGYLLTSPHAYHYDLGRPFFETVNQLGVPINTTTHNGDPIGITTLTAAVDPETRVRSYSTNAYYEPCKSRSNLVVMTGAHATKIHLDDKKDQNGDFRATGVTFVTENKSYTVFATREVIICAGTIQTPVLLELSGIGPRHVLTDLGISVNIELPGVGENLQDHFGVVVNAQASSKFTTGDQLADPDFYAAEMRKYTESRQGMFSSAPSTVGFMPLEMFMDRGRLDEITRELDAGLESTQTQGGRIFDLQRSWIKDDRVPQLEVVLFPALSNALTPPTPGCKYYSLALFIQHPFSRGSVHAKSADGESPPSLDFGLLRGPGGNFDLRVLVEAVRWACRVTQTEPLASGTEALLEPSLDASEEQLEDFVRKKVYSGWHPVGTAAMCPREAGGVVDNKLKVYGTSNLRVVDASVFPIQLGTHPQATIYGFSHIAAEIIESARFDSH